MSLSESRTIASQTKKNEILLLPGFEEVDHCTAKELKEYVRMRAAIYEKQCNKKIKGFTVGDFIESYNKDPKTYRPYQMKAIENLKEDIDQISSSAKKAKDDLKEFEADKTIESRERSRSIAKEQPPKRSKTKEEDGEDREAEKLRLEQERLKQRQEVLDRIAKKEVEAIKRGEITNLDDVKTDAGYKALVQRIREQEEAEEVEEAERNRKHEEEIKKWREEMQQRQFLEDKNDDY